MAEYHSHKSTWESALDVNTSQSTIYHHLKKIRKVTKLGIWLPHTLSEKNKEDHISIVTSLLSRQRNDQFLNIITGYKKWVFHDNVQCKRQWTDKDESLLHNPKVEIYERKIMLYLWWDQHDIIHFKFLNCNQTLKLSLATICSWKSKKMPCTCH